MNPRISSNGTKRWYNEHGQSHRSDGPAVIAANGSLEYWFNGQYHRTDGPAIIYPNGYHAYWFNDKLHRTDGPAVIWSDGDIQYWIHDNQLTEDEYYDIIQSEEHLNWYLLQL